MKKLLLAATLAVAAGLSASAEVISNYTEQFENPTFRPRGWKYHLLSTYSCGSVEATETGGHSGGYITMNQYSTSWSDYGDYWSSYYNNYNYIDLLVTPKVQGEVSIWVRKNGNKPVLTFYNIADNKNIPTYANEIKMLEGTDKNEVEGKDIDDWTKITLSDVPEGTYLGIRAHNLDLDEFTAETAEVMYTMGLSLDIKKISPSNTTLEADADNQITFEFEVTANNIGDVDFPGGEPGIKVSLVNVPLNKEFGCGYITDAIPWTTSVSKTFTMTGDAEVDPSTATNQYKVVVSLSEDNAVESSLGYFTVIPYLPVTKLIFFEDNDKNQSSYNDVNIDDMMTVGAGPAETTSRTVYLWNSGTAEMNVTSVTAGTGFKTDVEEPFTVEPKGKKAITISLTGEPGLYQDTLRIFTKEIDEAKYAIQGLITKEGDYSETFESENLPSGMIISPSIKHADTTDSFKPLCGDKFLEYTSTYGSAARVITPKLAFTEGEKFTFMAAKADNTSGTIEVFTSPDRVNWTSQKWIVASTYNTEDEHFNISKPTGTGYGYYEFRVYSLDMPEGEYYVAFDLKGARLDNLNGGTLVEVAHDPYLVNYGIPSAAEVNTRYITSATIRNLLPTPETDYKVELKVDNEIVATAPETPEIASGEEATFDLRYMPHAEGTFTAQMLFTVGQDTTVMHTFEIVVGPEKAEKTYQLGTHKIQTTDPMNTYYNTQAQIIYRAADLGMDQGMKITGFTFNGYNTKELSKNVKVWIANTEVDRFDSADILPLDPEEMTLVYDGVYDFPVVGVANKEYVPLFIVPFSEPFVYDGKNVCVMIQQTDTSDDQDAHAVYFSVDNSVYDYWNDIYDDRVIENSGHDYADDLLEGDPKWNVYKGGFPVTYFNVAKDVAVLKGNITDEFGAAVGGAKVTIDSDDVQYYATSNVEGAYSMSVTSMLLTYTASVKADGYEECTADEITFSEETLETVKDFTLRFADRTATLSGEVTTSLEEDDPVFNAVVTLTCGDTSVSVYTNDNGKYSLTVPELADTYTLTIAVDDVTYLTEEFTFTAKAQTKDFSIEWTGPATLKGKVTSSLNNGESIEGVTVTLTDKDGKAYSSTTGEEGTYTIDVPKFVADYTLTVVRGEVEYVNEAFKFTRKDQTKNFRIDYSSIAELEAVNGANNTIYDLSGRKLDKAGRGIYIINGVKTLVK